MKCSGKCRKYLRRFDNREEVAGNEQAEKKEETGTGDK